MARIARKTAQALRRASSCHALLALLFAAGCDELGQRCNQPMIPWWSIQRCDAIEEVYTHDPEIGMCTLTSYGGCGASENVFDSLEECESTCSVTPRALPCTVTATDPSLPGVSIRIDADRCRIPVHSLQYFQYFVSVDEPITYDVTAPGELCAICPGPFGQSPGPRLVRIEMGAGELWYDSHSESRGPANCCELSAGEYTLRPQISSGRFLWSSFTSASAEQPTSVTFPAGTYEVRVSLAVPGLGTVVARLPVELVGTDVR